VTKMKILIISYHNPFNKGEASILHAMIDAINKTIPGAEFTALSLHPEIDPIGRIAKVLPTIPPSCPGWRAKLKVVPLILQRILWTMMYGVCKLNVDALVEPEVRRTLQAYAKADVIVSRGNDCFTDAHGIGIFLAHIYDHFLATMLNKKVVIYAQTIGPFKDNLMGSIFRFLTKIVLNRMELITVRETISEKILREMGVTRPAIYVTADSAFLLQPAPSKRVEEIMLREGVNKKCGGPVVGIVISTVYNYGFLPHVKSSKEKYRKYVKLMKEVVDYVASKLNATVVLLVHVSSPPTSTDYDKLLNRDVYQLVKYKTKVKLINNEYTCQELKGIIGQFDLLISSRMHPIIHALSMYVPVVGIGYTYKAKGIMKMVGLDRFVCDLKTLNVCELTSKIGVSYSSRDKIRRDLRFRMRVIRERAMLNAKLLKDVTSAMKRNKWEC